MEQPHDPESREAFIERRISEVADMEGMSPDDIFSDIATFAELLQEDTTVRSYFEELAERIGVSTEEMIEYATRENSENS